MNLISKNIVPPKEWEHDKYIKDYYNSTVEYYLRFYRLPLAP